jgi:hypothetical protein
MLCAKALGSQTILEKDFSTGTFSADFTFFYANIEFLWKKFQSFDWLQIRSWDPVPFWPLDPGWVKNQDPDTGSGSAMNNPDHISKSLNNFFIFWVKYLNSFMWIRNPGWKKFRSGIEKIRIRDKHPGS